MQEHACKEPTDSLAPWWDIIGAFVGEGILHQLEAFLQTMCHAGQSTRSSWNWRKPMRPYGELSWTDCADWSFRSKPDNQLNSKQFKQAKLCYLYLFMVKLLHLLHLLQLHPWSGLNGLILTTKRRIIGYIGFRIDVSYFHVFLEWCNLTTPKDHKRSNFKNNIHIYRLFLSSLGSRNWWNCFGNELEARWARIKMLKQWL